MSALRPQRALFPNSGPGKPLSGKGLLLSESGQLMVTIDGHFMVSLPKSSDSDLNVRFATIRYLADSVFRHHPKETHRRVTLFREQNTSSRFGWPGTTKPPIGHKKSVKRSLMIRAISGLSN